MQRQKAVLQLIEQAERLLIIWYGGNGYNPSGASADYIVNGYVNWMNQVVGMFPTTWGTTTIPNFSGVPANKLVIGVLASTSAGGAASYATPDMIAAAFLFKLKIPQYN